MTELHVNVKNSSTLVIVSFTKRAVQTLDSSEVNNFIEVFSHNIVFSVVFCAFFLDCAFVAEKGSEIFLAGVKISEQVD